MKYFKFWVSENYRIKINGVTEDINILAGSNQSKEAARTEAYKRSKQIETRIESGDSVDNYEVPIREYVSDVVDGSNIVTVCRYGAKILNSTQYTILDLDEYPVDFMDYFRPVRKLPKKKRIIAKFLERLKSFPELGSDFRIYETSKGVRVIGKKYIDPQEKGYKKLMRKFSVDWLYIVLSMKQDCYRARITPKPYRMKIKTIKIKTPLDCEAQKYVSWAQSYQAESKKYSVVKFIESVGADFSMEPVIKLHDQYCHVSQNKKLA